MLQACVRVKALTQRELVCLDKQPDEKFSPVGRAADVAVLDWRCSTV